MAIFDALHSRVNDAKASACAFDLLMLNGKDLRRKPYVERKAALRKLLRHGRGIQYVEHAEGYGDKLFEAVCKLGFGGRRFKGAECALPLGIVENLDQSQKSEIASSYAGH